MDELMELFKGQLAYEYFEKFTYRELDSLKKSRIARHERQQKREEENRRNVVVR